MAIKTFASISHVILLENTYLFVDSTGESYCLLSMVAYHGLAEHTCLASLLPI